MDSVSRRVIAGACLAFALSVTSLPTYAQVYKCKDSSGTIVYSGKPCEYGGKPLPLSDNVVQAERLPADAYGTSTSGSTGPSVSGECMQAQYESQEQASKGAPRGIVDANRYRRTSKQLSSRVQVACGSSGGGGGGNTARQQAPRNPESAVSGDCVQAKRQLQDQLGKPVPAGIADANRQRQNTNQLVGQYEAMCGGGVSADGPQSPAKPKRETVTGFNPYAGQPSTLCPDGSYVRGASCQLCPDGSYVTGGSGCQITPKGTFVQGGKPSTICPDGSYVAGRCRMGPDGKYYGE